MRAQHFRVEYYTVKKHLKPSEEERIQGDYLDAAGDDMTPELGGALLGG